jgi:hypothetical protein
MIVPGPARRCVDLETDFAAQALAWRLFPLLMLLLPCAIPPRIVIARSKATKQSILSCGSMDCFAALAMTV